MFLVVNHSDRSVPSSSMLFALYIRALYLSFSLSTMNLQPEHYYSLYQIGILSTWCDCQPHLLCFLLHIVQLVSILYLMLNSFVIYLKFAYPSYMQTRQSLRVYLSHVGDRCLMRRVNNCVSVREWATMRCIR